MLGFIVVILEGEGRTWDTEIRIGGERRIGAIVHEIEATNAMMVIMVDEEFGEIANLVFVGYTEGYVFVNVGWGRSGFGIVTVPEGIG